MRLLNRTWCSAILVLLASNGCGRSDGPSPYVFSMGLTRPPHRHLDPVLFDDAWSTLVSLQVHGRLYKVDRRGRVVPDIATSYESIDGGLTHVIGIDTHRKFSDGSTVTPEDVVYSLRRVADPAVNKTTAFLLDRARRIEKLSPTSVQIRTLERVLTLPTILTAAQGAILKAPKSEDRPGPSSPTSGAYVVSDWAANKIRLDRNPHFRHRPKAPSAVEFHIEDEETTLREFRAGRRSFARVMTAASLRSLSGRERRHLRTRLTATLYFVLIPDVPGASNLLALLCDAIDHQFVQRIYGHTQQKLDSLFPTVLLATMASSSPWSPCYASAGPDPRSSVPPIRVQKEMSGASKFATRIGDDVLLRRHGLRAQLTSWTQIEKEYVDGRFQSPVVFGFIPAYLDPESLLRQWFSSDGGTALFAADRAITDGLRDLSNARDLRARNLKLSRLLRAPRLRAQYFPLMEERLTYLFDSRIENFTVSRWGDYYMDISAFLASDG